MQKSVAIQILGSPSSSASLQTALSYSKALLSMGHKIERLFFYNEAVIVGSEFTISSQDEINLPKAWQEFIKTHEIDTVICIASALKRGILDKEESQRYDISGFNLSETVSLGGLGLWIECINTADQTIVFGN